MKFIIILLLTFLLRLPVSAQTIRTENMNNGEAVAGCQVIKNNVVSLGFTNALGLIELDENTLLETDTLTFIALGYSHKRVAFSQLDTIQTVLLVPLQFELAEITISDKHRSNMEVDDGKIQLNTKFLEKLPTVFGEPDLFKNFQLLPGITSSMENNTGIYVRGGASNQTLILVDGAPLFNSSHSAGFFSALSPSIVKSATLYKNAIPSRYGTRASAVVDLQLHDGNPNHFDGSAQFGIISSSFNIKGPLQKRSKDKPYTYLSYQLSARTTYVDKFLALVLPEEDQFLETGFEDYSFKLHKQIDIKRSLQFSYYRSDDRFSIPSGILLSTGQTSNWSNNLVNLSYKSNPRKNKVNVCNIYYSKYQIENKYVSSVYQNSIANFGFRWNSSFELNKGMHEYGAELNAYYIEPGKLINNTELAASFNDFTMADETPISSAAYYDYSRISNDSSWYVKLGGRLAQFDNFFNLQPRLLLKKHLTSKQSLSISYDRMAQFINLYTANIIDLPTDIWYSANEALPPTISNSLSLHYSNRPGKAWHLNLAAYIRRFYNAKDVREGAPIFITPGYKSDVHLGQNTSYGAEVLLEYNSDRLNGWLSYTYSRSINKIAGINDNMFYPANWDRPHVGNIVLNYEMAPNWTINGVFNVSSGRPLTYPLSTIGSIRFYSNRNEYRLPTYHRLDLGIRKKQRKHKHHQLTWALNIYNIYNRRNPYAILRNPSSLRVEYISLFPILPFFSLKANFF